MSLHNTEPTNYNDEIDLFELWDILWSKKYLMLSITFLTTLTGFLYATYSPIKPDYYTGKVTVEIGTYMTNTGEILSLEPAGDLAVILGEKSGVSVSSPRGTERILELESTHQQQTQAKQQLEQALANITERHQNIAKKLPESQRVSATQPVSEPSYKLSSAKDKRPLITAVAGILGLMASFFLILLMNAIQNRKQRLNPNQ